MNDIIITSNLRLYQIIGKNMFSIGKNVILNTWEFCEYCRIFGIRKGPEYLYQFYDVLH